MTAETQASLLPWLREYTDAKGRRTVICEMCICQETNRDGDHPYLGQRLTGRTARRRLLRFVKHHRRCGFRS